MSKTSPYDELPYPRLAFAQSHPNHLGAIGRLFGTNPTPPSRARILELGCAQGGNLLPMAVGLPSAELVGLDFSQRQIDDGKATRDECGITNARLLQANLLEVDDSWGQFDYIIAHGLYSWVSPEVQAKVMEVCSRNLAPNGIAYVSYNCNPGWRIRGMFREMMLFHTAGLKSPADKIKHARALLDYLASYAGQKTPYGAMLQREAATIRNADDAYLFHEHLETNNQSVYFHEFMAQAHQVGLMYLAESPIQTMFDVDFDAKTTETLQQLGSGNILHVEQYMDFLRNRTFRQTLLVHKNIHLTRNLDWRNLLPLRIGINQALSCEPHDVSGCEATEYTELPSGLKFTVTHPGIKAALQLLREQSPQSVTFGDLVALAKATSRSSENIEEVVATQIYGLLAMGVANITIEPWLCATSVGDRPKASALARKQAGSADPIITLRHQHTNRTPSFLWRLLQLVDGRTINEVAEAIVADAQAGKLQIKREGKPIKDPTDLMARVKADLPTHLGHLREMALLLPH